ncbi:hypothetical protein P7H60_06445 [Vagococcus carniphilus]|nr:hypothetical protein [Vagococcus carniphilus]MDT2848796.1 hypothetical protein [Vagococcus carniphilus]
MNIGDWILVIAIVITLCIAIPAAIESHKILKSMEKHYERRSGVEEKKKK